MIDYYPFGKALREVEAIRADYQTTQHERDEETDLDYRNARFYDSDLGQFLSVDPLAGEYASWTPYHYVHNNPINMIDPTGMSAEWVPKIGNNGEVVYVSEDGDSYNTFVEQYGEEAAQEVFTDNLGDGFSETTTFANGEVTFGSKSLYPLNIVNKHASFWEYFAGKSDVTTLTSAQDIYNQILAVSEYSRKFGDGSMTAESLFRHPSGGSIGQIVSNGPITVSDGGTYGRGAIRYSSSLRADGKINAQPDNRSIPNGYKEEYRTVKGSYNIPLLVTFRTKSNNRS